MTTQISRRDFLALMGIGSAAATVGCNQSFEEKWDPWVKPTEGDVPYVPRYYATCTREAGAEALWVKTVNGRAQKLEGNPESPINRGRLTARAQTGVQSLYGAGRVKLPADKSGNRLTWRETLETFSKKIEENKGSNISALTPTMTGSMNEVWTKFVATVGSGSLVQFDPFSPADQLKAAEIAFAQNAVPFVSLAGAEVVFSLGAQFLETWGNPSSQTREYAALRDVAHGKRVIHIQAEAKRSGTGANADIWLAAKPGSETVLALALLREVAAHSHHLTADEKAKIDTLTQGYDMAQAASATGVSAADLGKAAEYLVHAKDSVVLPAETLALGNDVVKHQVAVMLLNKALGGIGKHYNFAAGIPANRVSDHSQILALIEAMKQGQVKVLVIKDANPVYHLPKSLGFEEALSKVEFVVALADTANETTRLADLIIPAAHDLESWGEVNSHNGLDMLMQPTMRPRFELKQAEDLLLGEINKHGGSEAASMKDYVKQSWMARFGGDESSWRNDLKKGGRFDLPQGSDLPISGNLSDDYFAGIQDKAHDLALVVHESYRYGDGTFANRPWMQELPDSMTGMVWDSWLEVTKAYAKTNGLKYGTMVTLSANGQSFELPVFICETNSEHVVALATGQGHTHYGDAYNRGVNALQLWSAELSEAGLFRMGPMAFSVAKSRGRQTMATPHVPGKGDRINTPQTFSDKKDPHFDRHLFMAVGVNQLNGHGDGHSGGHRVEPEHTSGHDEVKKGDNRFPLHKDHDFYPNRDDDPVVWGREETFYDPYKWEMSIDLNRCTGCGSCVTACYAENNLPAVGRDQFAKGREMAWIRINRYLEFPGEGFEEGAPAVRFLPMMCQQCGSAPCETVCPTLATYHSKDGLNAMVYNRCVGTRYCANNCTYKVRRYNWFDYEFEGDLNWQLNPDISHRGRGVMEKCTFCVQRIRDAGDAAKDEKRLVRDGEVQTACQQICPADAIAFGNIKDESSVVAKNSKDERAYRALDDHIHTKPAISYLKRVTLENQSHNTHG